MFGLAELAGRHKQEAALANLEKDRAALERRLRELEKSNRDLTAQLQTQAPAPALMPAKEAGAEPRANPAAPGDASEPFRGRFDGGRFLAMLSDPEMRRLMTVQEKAALDGRFSSLFKALNLSPEALEKFKNLLVEKQSAMTDVISAARKEGMDPRSNRDEIRQLVQSTQAEIDETIRSTLGDAAFGQYKNFETTQPQRIIANQLTQRLSYSTNPLSDTQSEQLVGILAANAGGNTDGGGGFGSFRGGRPGGPASKITDVAVTQAQGILSAQQLTALRSLQAEQQAAADLARQMREAHQDSGTGTTRTTTRPSGK